MSEYNKDSSFSERSNQSARAKAGQFEKATGIILGSDGLTAAAKLKKPDYSTALPLLSLPLMVACSTATEQNQELNLADNDISPKKQQVERRYAPLSNTIAQKQEVERRTPPEKEETALTSSGETVRVSRNVNLTHETYIRERGAPYDTACSVDGFEQFKTTNILYRSSLEERGIIDARFEGTASVGSLISRQNASIVMDYRKVDNTRGRTSVGVAGSTSTENRTVSRAETFGILNYRFSTGQEQKKLLRCVCENEGEEEAVPQVTPSPTEKPATPSSTPTFVLETPILTQTATSTLPPTFTAYPTPGQEYQAYPAPTASAEYRHQPAARVGFVRVKKEVDLDGDRVPNTPRDLAIASNLEWKFEARIGDPIHGTIDRFSMRGNDQWARGADYPCSVPGVPGPIPYYVRERATYQGIDILAFNEEGHLCTDDFARFLNVGRPLLPPPPGAPLPTAGPFFPVVPFFPSFTPTETATATGTSTVTLTLRPTDTPTTFIITPSSTSTLVIASATPSREATPHIPQTPLPPRTEVTAFPPTVGRPASVTAFPASATPVTPGVPSRESATPFIPQTPLPSRTVASEFPPTVSRPASVTAFPATIDTRPSVTPFRPATPRPTPTAFTPGGRNINFTQAEYADSGASLTAERGSYPADLTSPFIFASLAIALGVRRLSRIRGK